jgi:hypothetical protein
MNPKTPSKDRIPKCTLENMNWSLYFVIICQLKAKYVTECNTSISASSEVL